MRKVLLFAVVSLLLLSCGRKGRSGEGEAFRGIYYWKTDFVITPSDSAFLSAHRIDRIYLRFFDVILSNKAITGYTGPVPNATVTFSSPKPESIEIVPVVFITLEALKDMTVSGRTGESAGKIFSRIDAMCRSHGLGPLREIQIDCDYTERTKDGYFALCKALRAFLEPKGISLTSTLRLHQLRDAAPPVDAVSLMLYNTDNFRRADVDNSILNPQTVKTYLKGDYPLPASVALPLYSWGIWMRDGSFRAILHKSEYSDTLLYKAGEDNRYTVIRDHIVEGHDLREGDVIRMESSPIEVVTEVQEYARRYLGSRSVILYHLDSLSLSRYSFDQIEKLYSHASD